MLFPIKNTLIHCPFISLLTHFPSFFLQIQQITYTFHTFPIIYSLTSTQTDLLSYAISNQKHTYPLSFYLPTHSLSFILPSNTTNNLHFPHISHYLFPNIHTNWSPFLLLFPIKNTLIHCPFISLLTHFPSFFLQIQQITYTFHTFPIIYSLTSTQTDLLSYCYFQSKTHLSTVLLSPYSLTFLHSSFKYNK